MIGFIVATPLQLFNSFVVMNHFFKDKKMDIFALDISCDMHASINKYSKSDFINNVYYLNNLCSHRDRIGLIKDYAFLSKAQKKFLNNIRDVEYSDLFTTWVGGSGTWLFTKIKKNNPHMRLHFYEEGLGVYLRELYSQRYGGIRIFWKLLGYKFEGEYLQDIFLYQPLWAQKLPSSLNKVQIGNINRDEYLRIKEIPGEISQYNEEYIFFENNFHGTEFEGINEKEIIDTLISATGKSQCLVRLHPMSCQSKYKDEGYIIDTRSDYPWEDIVCLDKNIENKVLITTISTAVFTPKMIFGFEPTVIILGLAVSNEYSNYTWSKHFWSHEFEKLCLDFRGSYNIPSKVFIPKDFAELISFLRGRK